MHRETFRTTLGQCAVSWDESARLTGFELPEAKLKAEDVAEFPAPIRRLIDRVHAHLSGDFQDFVDEPFAFHLVPDFARKVYLTTLAVKAGQTTTYGEIAVAIGHTPAASRAVGAALGANPWPLVIPCHRVVSASGKMTGFSSPGGVSTKVKLLALEGAQLLAE